jgi:hypothetical protein
MTHHDYVKGSEGTAPPFLTLALMEDSRLWFWYPLHRRLTLQIVVMKGFKKGGHARFPNLCEVSEENNREPQSDSW